MFSGKECVRDFLQTRFCLQIIMINAFVLKTSLLTKATQHVLTSLLPVQPVRTAFLYESKHRVNVMKRMAAHGIHNQLGKKRGQVHLWEKLIRGEEVVVGE